MAHIQYIGDKERKVDNVSDTGIVWARGQVHVVPDAKAAPFLRHSTVWRLVRDANEPLPPPPAPIEPPPAPPVARVFAAVPEEPWLIVASDVPDTPINLEVMTLQELRLFSKDNNLGVAGNLNTELTRKAVLERALATSQQ